MCFESCDIVAVKTYQIMTLTDHEIRAYTSNNKLAFNSKTFLNTRPEEARERENVYKEIVILS